MFLSLAFFLSAQTVDTVFTANGIFVVPAGVTEIIVQAWGGGGGAAPSGNGSQGGGGGGAYARDTLTVTPLSLISLTIGQGGAPGTGGGETSFGVFVVAPGGNSGSGSSGGLGGSGGTGLFLFNGGNGASAVGNAGGGGGGSATSSGNGGNGSGTTGGPGEGNGGPGGPANNGAGGNGLEPGGGGGGSGGPGAGAASGSGAEGRIIVTYTLTPDPCATLTLAVGDSIPPQCFGGNDGFISVVVTGGNTPYSFSWEDDLLNTDSTRTGLEAGSYKV